MIATTLEMQNEAISRIKILIKKLNLNANILEYFKDGKKYYSYLTGGGFLGSVDTIQYDEDYEKAVKWFEKKYSNSKVFYIILLFFHFVFVFNSFCSCKYCFCLSNGTYVFSVFSNALSNNDKK